MNILIAPDKFKGSLTAVEVCDVVSEALLELNPSLQISKVPLADGGEGTFDILVAQSKGRIKKVVVLDPLQRPIEAEYGLSKDGTIAFIEMAKASGLQLLSEVERNPLHTTTIGTGQLIMDALDEGATHIILGIGGSATNDAGIGLAHSLGYRFLNKEKELLKPIGESLSAMDWIDDHMVDPRLRNVKVTVLCDVENPLFGVNGAAYVYGPQKGATQEIIEELDKGLRHFADVAKRIYAVDLNFPGAGAAGGMGSGGKLFLQASFKKGIDYISELTDLAAKVAASDLVITGEGKVDKQTLSGKVVAHVLALANLYQKPVIILCGLCVLSDKELEIFGTSRILALANFPSEISQAMANPIPLIKSRIKNTLSYLT